MKNPHRTDSDSRALRRYVFSGSTAGFELEKLIKCSTDEVRELLKHFWHRELNLFKLCKVHSTQKTQQNLAVNYIDCSHSQKLLYWWDTCSLSDFETDPAIKTWLKLVLNDINHRIISFGIPQIIILINSKICLFPPFLDFKPFSSRVLIRIILVGFRQLKFAFVQTGRFFSYLQSWANRSNGLAPKLSWLDSRLNKFRDNFSVK